MDIPVTFRSKLLLLFSLLAVSSLSFGQANIKQPLFQEADAAIEAAKNVSADKLAPKSYTAGLQAYQRASKDFARGGDLNAIRNELKKAVAALKKSTKATELAAVTLASVMQARADAENANAAEYAADLWKTAESSFTKAAITLEDGNVKNAQKRAAKAKEQYSAAELAAIKANYLDETRNLLAQAEKNKVKRYAPKTLQKSKDLLAQAEKALNENRYDTDAPRNLARQAKYEAKHAIYISKKLQAVKAGKSTLEDLYLDLETPVITIAEAADIVAELDEGYEKTTGYLVDYIDVSRRNTQALTEEVNSGKQRITEMEDQLALLENKLGGATAEGKALKQRIANEAAIQQTFTNIEKKFDRKSAEVFRQGNNVILRLVGLNFDSGKSEIDSKNFSLLKQVQQAIESFTIDKVTTEGHTDSYGSDASNLELSNARATAVREYLLANMEIDANAIDAIGYGETRPVANNETADGRRKNRRIDIVIQPKL